MNELLELIQLIQARKASAATVRSLLADQNVDTELTHAEAVALLAEMTATIDTDPNVTADAIRAVRTVLAATAPPSQSGEDVTGDSQDDTDAAQEPDTDGDADGDIQNTTVPNQDDAKPTADNGGDADQETNTDDGGGAVTLNENQGDTAVEGEVISAEAFKASGSGRVNMTMTSPGVAARFSDSAAANAPYQAFAGGGGQELNTAGDVAKHVGAQFDLLRSARGSSDPRGVSLVQYQAREGAMKFHRTRDMGNHQVEQLLDSAVQQHFAEATPTWCAPAVQHYEFCPLPNAWGLFGDALPIITSERGSNTWPMSPVLGNMWGQGIECRTADEEAARAEEGTPKGCTHIDCLEWSEFPDRICHICVTSKILQNKAFPEDTDQMVRSFELLYEHWINWQMLKVAIEIADEQNGELRWDTAGYGILPALKEKIAFAVDSLSARSLFDPWTTQWNLAVPFWMYSVIQNDLARRIGADTNMMSLTREPIDIIIRGGRNVRIWPLMPWQQALTEDVPDPSMSTWLGSDTSLQGGKYPDTMEMLLWPQGALIGVRDDFLDIRARWDYGLQRQNQQLEMFSETQWNVIPRCGEILHITLDICAAGRSGTLFDYCAPAPAPAPAPAAPAELAPASKKKS